MPKLQLSVSKLGTPFHLAQIVQLNPVYYSDALFTMLEF